MEFGIKLDWKLPGFELLNTEIKPLVFRLLIASGTIKAKLKHIEQFCIRKWIDRGPVNKISSVFFGGNVNYQFFFQDRIQKETYACSSRNLQKSFADRIKVLKLEKAWNQWNSHHYKHYWDFVQVGGVYSSSQNSESNQEKPILISKLKTNGIKLVPIHFS